MGEEATNSTPTREVGHPKTGIDAADWAPAINRLITAAMPEPYPGMNAALVSLMPKLDAVYAALLPNMNVSTSALMSAIDVTAFDRLGEVAAGFVPKIEFSVFDGYITSGLAEALAMGDVPSRLSLRGFDIATKLRPLVNALDHDSVPRLELNGALLSVQSDVYGLAEDFAAAVEAGPVEPSSPPSDTTDVAPANDAQARRMELAAWIAILVSLIGAAPSWAQVVDKEVIIEVIRFLYTLANTLQK